MMTSAVDRLTVPLRVGPMKTTNVCPSACGPAPGDPTMRSRRLTSPLKSPRVSEAPARSFAPGPDHLNAVPEAPACERSITCAAAESWPMIRKTTEDANLASHRSIAHAPRVYNAAVWLSNGYARAERGIYGSGEYGR